MNRVSLGFHQLTTNHPELNGSLLLDAVEEALRKYHGPSPASFTVWHDEESSPADVHFGSSNSGTANTVESTHIPEIGAIAMAVALIDYFEGKRVLRRAEIGSRVDYFVVNPEDNEYRILEVSGTEHGDFETRRHQKKEQLLSSCYRGAPFHWHGMVAVTRFASHAHTCLDTV